MASEDDSEYNRVLGVKFRQPPDHFGLNDESITDDWFYVAVTLGAAIPIVGLAFATSGLMLGFGNRDDNAFRMDEQLWKTGVYGAILQIISLALLGLGLLAV